MSCCGPGLCPAAEDLRECTASGTARSLLIKRLLARDDPGVSRAALRLVGKPRSSGILVRRTALQQLLTLMPTR